MKTFFSYTPQWFRVMMVASLAVVTYGIGNLDNASTDPAVEATQVEIQAHEIHEFLWIDKVPEMMHDSWHGLIFTPDNVGISVDAESAFKLTLEIFEFQIKKSTLRWHFPHDGRKSDSKFTIEKLKKPTKHFDRQLTIENDPTNGGKTKVYFTGPEFGNSETIESLAPGVTARLRGHLNSSN